MAKAKKESRAARWVRVSAAAVSAVEELVEMREEFVAWLENLDGKFSGSPLVEKLEAMEALDLDSALSSLQEAEAADVPLGFGRD